MILIVGPNTGAYLGPGGGSRVVLNAAEMLAEAGYEVRLIAAEGLPIKELDALHGTNLNQYVEKGSLKVWYFLGKNLPHILFPMKVRLLSAFLSRKIAGGSIDLIVFHDDVPKPLVSRQWQVKTLLYSFFPYMARLYFNVRDPYEANETLSVTKDRLIRITTRSSIFVEERPNCTLLACSTVTRSFMEKVWGRGINVLYPPIKIPAMPSAEKEDIVTMISAIQPNKRIGDALSAFALTKLGKLCIIGRVYNRGYYDWLLKRISELKLDSRVNIVTNADDNQKNLILSRSKIILSSTHFEPFGMSVAEGMSFGCLPLVYKSELSGPWVDICDRGNFGLGFKDINELACLIDSTMSDSNFEEYSIKAMKRSQDFSLECFKEKWLDTVTSTLQTH
jgi:glycosyltransferase involved in cell wall biosynthesis